jgi:hypothetical protein
VRIRVRRRDALRVELALALALARAPLLLVRLLQSPPLLVVRAFVPPLLVPVPPARFVQTTPQRQIISWRSAPPPLPARAACAARARCQRYPRRAEASLARGRRQGAESCGGPAHLKDAAGAMPCRSSNASSVSPARYAPSAGGGGGGGGERVWQGRARPPRGWGRRRDETCPVSTEGGARRAQLVREGVGGRRPVSATWMCLRGFLYMFLACRRNSAGVRAWSAPST